MNTTYSPRSTASYRSTYTPKAIPTERISPIQAEINKYLRDYQLTATFEVDTDTQSLLKHVPNTIAFRCVLKKDGRIVAVGRGTNFLNKNNRYVDKAVAFTAHASLIDATVRAVKTIEALDASVVGEEGSIASTYPKSPEFEPMTDKQRHWLEALIQNVGDEEEHDEWTNKLSTMTRKEASEAIASLKEF